MTLFLLFLLLHFTEASDQGLSKVTAKPGTRALLECHSPRPGVVSLVEWSRADLDSGGYIYFYRDEREYRKFQHPSFVDRVELRDPTMKGGDVSVFVDQVTANDTGTYQCYVSTINNSGRRKRESVSRTIELVVEESGDVGGLTGSRSSAGGSAAALVIVAAAAAVVAVVVIRHKRHKKQSPMCENDEPLSEGVQH